MDVEDFPGGQRTAERFPRAQSTQGKQDRAVDVTLLPLARLADVDEQRPFPRHDRVTSP